jgi:predicted nucleic acid-binding protein
MTSVLVDSNVLLDLLTRDPLWLAWSREALAEAVNTGTLVIDPVIYSEISVHFSRKEDLDAAFPADQYMREDISYEAAFLAGKAFLHYRRRGGPRLSPLPDFFIGAHAAVAGYRLLTRDPGRYRTYFPKLELIAPG